ncbi:MAG: hypothetical protein FWC66_03165 [Oscillospiraceae bacterium]|nr:hypothetical protein [Oscillospiraceae bacterium]
MFKLSPITDRVSKTREKYREAAPAICLSRYKLITEYYKNNPAQSGILRRARNFKNICEHIAIRVEEGELIVGTATSMYRGVQLYPEHSIAWILDEVRTGLISTRDCDPYLISDEDRDYLLETGDYWIGECNSAKVDAYIPNGWFGHAPNGVTLFGKSGQAQHPVGHFITSYDRAINVGFGAIKAEAEMHISRLEKESIPAETIDNYNFYRAVAIVCEGVIILAKRYAAHVSELAENEEHNSRKQEMLMMADTLNWIMENPCRNFFDAVQATYMYQICMTLDGCMHAISYGRIDQYFGKFYEQDISAGVLTPAYAQEIIDMFFIKTAEINRVWGHVATRTTGGYTTNQLITLGGVTKEGADATNPVTYMCLQASARLVLHTPPLAMRIHEDTPAELWEAAIETTRLVGGIPTFENDDMIIPALMKRGLSLESARNYGLIGCVEPAGCGDEWPTCGGTGTDTYLNLMGTLMLGINNGYYTMPDRWGNVSDNQVGLPTGYLYEMESMEEIVDAYKKQTEFFVQWYAKYVNSYEYVTRQNIPLPVISATMEGCMESGKDVTWGGAKYNSVGVAGVGIGNVADSLNIIKHLCFDTKKCTTKELYDAIMANWDGYEELYHYIVSAAPHFGNADSQADMFAAEASEIFVDAVDACSGPRCKFAAGLYPVTVHVIMGAMTQATPDGRRKGEPLADGISPVQQMDRQGPTSSLLSISKIDQSRYSNGTLLNMKFHPSSVSNEEGITKMAHLIKAYFGMGGMQMQINFVSADELREAQLKPQEYKNLVVRVAGFSTYFVDLFEDCQNDLINRTEYAF